MSGSQYHTALIAEINKALRANPTRNPIDVAREVARRMGYVFFTKAEVAGGVVAHAATDPMHTASIGIAIPLTVGGSMGPRADETGVRLQGGLGSSTWDVTLNLDGVSTTSLTTISDPAITSLTERLGGPLSITAAEDRDRLSLSLTASVGRGVSVADKVGQVGGIDFLMANLSAEFWKPDAFFSNTVLPAINASVSIVNQNNPDAHIDASSVAASVRQSLLNENFFSDWRQIALMRIYEQSPEFLSHGELSGSLPLALEGEASAISSGTSSFQIGRRADGDTYIILSEAPFYNSAVPNEAYETRRYYALNNVTGARSKADSVIRFEYKIDEFNNTVPDLERGVVITGSTNNLDSGPGASADGRKFPTDQQNFQNLLQGFDNAYRGNCFAAGTPVLMADGSIKPIEAVAVGDEVMSFDPAEDQGRGPLAAKRVVRLFVNEASEVVSVDGVRVTAGHPFLRADGSFQTLGQNVGPQELVAASGEPVTAMVSPGAAATTVYNFEVADWHTYVAGGLRVHNYSLKLDGSEGYVSFAANGDALGVVFTGSDGVKVIDYAKSRNTKELTTYQGSNFSNRVWSELNAAAGQTSDPDMQKVGAIVGGQVPSTAEATDTVLRWYNSDKAKLDTLNLAGSYGAAVGSILGTQLFGSSTFGRIAGSTVLSVVGENIAELLKNDFHTNLGLDLDTHDTIFSDLGEEFASAGIGAVSSYLVGELINAIGIKGTAGDFVSSAAGSTLGKIITNRVLGKPALNGLDGAQFGNLVGSFIGAKLAALVVNFGTVGGQIGSALGSSLGTIAAGEFLKIGGVLGGPLGAAIGAFAGFILGGLIGSIFGGTPRSSADVVWDYGTQRFAVANITARQGGSKETARDLGSTVANVFNTILATTGSQLDDPLAVQSGNYGMRGSKLTYRPVLKHGKDDITYSVAAKADDAFRKITSYGVVQGLTDPDFKLIGGSRIVKRAVYNQLSLPVNLGDKFDINALIGDLAWAQKYEAIIDNGDLVNLLITTEPGGEFAAETIITMARAAEIGLTRRAASDWFGGFPQLLNAAGTSAANISFAFDTSSTSGKIARLIIAPGYQLADDINVAGQSAITGTAAAEVIDLRSGKLSNQIGYTVDGHLNNDIALAGADFTAQALAPVAFAAADLRKSVTVTIAKDGLTEASESFLGQLSAGLGVAVVGGAAAATIVDDATAKPVLLIGRSFASETDGFAVFRLGLSKAAGSAVTVALATSANNAVAVTDYGTAIEVSANGLTGWIAATNATFAAGQTQLFVRVAVNPDNGVDGAGKATNVEGDERFTLTATATTGAAAIANASASGIGTIVDASSGSTPLAWIDGVTVDEASGQAVFSIARSHTGAPASVAFSTADRRELALDVDAIVDAADGNDTVYASDLGDTVLGGAGTDTLYGGRLDDWLFGGDDSDTINAGSTGSGSRGGDGNYLNGGDGNDLLFGREGSDWLEGGAGTDTLEGGDGDDVLDGSTGTADVMRGGRGNDQYIFRTGDVANAAMASADIIRDESGLTVETIVNQAYNDLSSSERAALVAQALSGGLFRSAGGLGNWRGGGVQTADDVAAGGEDVLVLGQGIGLDDIRIVKSSDGKDLIVELWPDGVFAGDRVVMKDWFSVFNKIETIRFADGNEVRIADFDTFILGTDASDTIIGTAYSDFVYAGAGNDLVYLLSGNDFGNGGLGDDTVSGGFGNDTVLGADGADDLIGGFGNDVVSGGRGMDYLIGDEGNDVLSGGASDDRVIGGAGDDVFRFMRGDGHDVLIDQLTDEWELIWVSGQGFLNGYKIVDGVVQDGAGATLYANGKWASDIRYDMETGRLRRYKPANPNATVVSSGQDVIEFGIGIDINDLRIVEVNGGKDLAIGIESSADRLAAFDALADSITLGEWGSTGNAAAVGSIEKFAFFNTGAIDVSATKLRGGGDGDDTIAGTAGSANWLTGGLGDDTLTGAALNDILNGNAGQDRLVGAAGSDILLGGTGDDVLIGGAGGTRDGKAAGDVLIGGEGRDVASYETAAAAVQASLGTPKAANDASAGEAAGDTYDSVEGLRGSAFADVLEGDAGDNDLEGRAGNDTLRGALGDDTYIFARGDGGDTLDDQYVASQDVVVDAAGNLELPYVARLELAGRDGGLYLFDQVVADADTGDVIYRKRLAGTTNRDLALPTTFEADGWVKDAGGNPIYTVSGAMVSAVMPAGPGGDDTILFEDRSNLTDVDTANDYLQIGLSDVTFAFGTGAAANDLTIALVGNPTDKVTVKGFRSGAAVDAARAIETMVFSDGSSVNLAGLRFDANGALLASTADIGVAVDDLLIGTVGADTLTGGAGNDTLSGGDGNDTLDGGDGNDFLVGGLGADVIRGGAGIDTVSYLGSDAGVTIDLAAATLASAGATGLGSEALGDKFDQVENVTGSYYADALTGTDGDNILRGNRGNDILSGGGGSGSLKGLGSDVLVGDEGDDTLTGGTGDDALEGGDGNDVLDGGGDRDMLSGGAGNDVLRGDGLAGTDVGANLIVNPGFEDAGAAADDVAQSYGLTTTDLPGWTPAAARPVQLFTSASGVTPVAGARALHLDDGGVNVQVSQTIASLRAGETFALNYSYAARAAGAASFDVLWNGVVVQTVSGGGTTAMAAAAQIILTAIDGNNVLAFRGAGAINASGAVVDSVRLTRTTGGADQLLGGAGTDRLEGGAGNDVLSGGDGDDAASRTVTGSTVGGLYGGAGDDTLDGGTGDDTLDGGDGNDSYVFGVAYGDDVVTTGGGQDDVVFKDLSSGQLWFSTGNGGADLVITGIGRGVSATIRNWFLAQTNQARRIVAQDKVLARSDVAALLAAMTAQSATVPTVVPAAMSSDVIAAMAAWQDPAAYTDRAVYYGTTGNDAMAPDPVWIGGVRYEALAGNDTVTAGASDDILVGGAGSDSLSGGDGNDVFRFAADAGYDALDGGPGTDTAVATAANAALYLQAIANVERVSAGGFANVQIVANTGATLDFTAVALDGVSRIAGGAGAETLTGSAGDDAIYGGAGNDVLKGGAGDDLIQGGAGSDTLDGGAGIDTLDLSDTSMAQSVNLAAGTATGETATNFENAIGGSAADTILGDAGVNRLSGLAGNDTLDGGAGDDVLIGGAGADILKGGDGSDAASYEQQTAASSPTSVVDTITINGVVVNLATMTSANGVSAPATKGQQGDAVGDWFYGVERLIGSGFNDALTGDAGDNELTGGTGDDVLDGGAGSDTAVYAGKYGDYLITTGSPVTTVRDNNIADGNDGTDRLRGVEYLRFTDVTVNLGVDPNNGPRLGQPIMADQMWDDGVAATYQIPQTAFYDLDLGDKMTLSATLEDGSALPAWLTFNAATQTFAGTPPVASIGGAFGVKVTANDPGNAAVSDVFVITIKQAIGATITGTAGADTRSGTFRSETMVGLAGNDILFGSAGADTLDGGADVDTVDYSASSAGVTIDLGAGTASGGDAEGDKLIAFEAARGSAYDDSITGTAGGNSLYGNAGKDVLNGGAGDDLLDGGTGADTLLGGAGKDTIYAAAGADGTIEDKVDGGDGVDTLLFTGSAYGVRLDLSIEGNNPASIENVVGSNYADTITGNEYGNSLAGGLGNDTIRGGYGADTLHGDAGNDIVDGGQGADLIYGDDGNDTLIGGAGGDTFYGGAGIDTVDYSASSANVVVNLTTNAGSGGDAAGDIFAAGTVENITGSQFDDVLTGSADANALLGLGGSDVLYGGAGNDTIDGGAGNDTLYGEAGNDTLSGGDGDDLFVSGSGADRYDGGTGNDTVDYFNTNMDAATAPVYADLTNVSSMYDAAGDVFAGVENLRGSYSTDTLLGDNNANVLRGEGGADVLYGRDGADQLLGGDGDDRLYGGANDDTLTGGAGNDRLAGEAGADAIDGGVGTDTLDYSASTARVTVNLATNALADGDAAGDTLVAGSIENIDGSAYADILTGTVGDNVLQGLAGGDVIYGGAGNDTIDGGNDADTLAGEAGSDTVTGGAGNDTVNGGADADYLYGGTGDDIVYGEDGADRLYGEDGNDTLYGGAGGNVLDGGAGSDTASYLWLQQGVQQSTGAIIDLATAANNTGAAAGDSYVNVENLYGTAGADDIRGDANANALTGDAGADTIRGAAGNDTVLGGASADTLYGDAGSDTINGGDDNDLLYGGSESDTLNGDAGNDTLYGGTDADTLNGGAGDDLLFGEGGSDIVNGSAGNDTIYLTALGEDTVDGGTETDTVNFTVATLALTLDLTASPSVTKISNVENIVGTAYADRLTGTAGANMIDGGAGDDLIQGGAGADRLTGGAGTDTLSYAGSAAGATFTTAAIGGVVVGSTTVAAAQSRSMNGVNVDLAANTATNADAAGDVITGFENLTGSANSDVLRGTAASSIVDGGAGDDVIYGGAGNDTLSGGAGNDFLFGEAGADTLYGGDGHDRLFGDGDSDTIYGGLGNDIIDAGDAGDSIWGEGGSDTLIGGAGDDAYHVDRASGNDTIYNYAAHLIEQIDADDAIVYGADVTNTDLWFTKASGTKDLIVKVLGVASQITIKNWFANTTAGDFADAGNDYVVRMFIAMDGIAATRQVTGVKSLLQLMAGQAEPASFGALSAPAQSQITAVWRGNTPPVVSASAGNPSAINEDATTVLYFDVQDNNETPAADLVLTATASGPLNVLAVEKVAGVGNEGKRKVTVGTAVNGSGAASLSLKVNDGVVDSAPLVYSLPVNAVADGVALVVPATTIGNVNTAIALAGISAAAIDGDGSESIDYLKVEALPVGAILSDGARSFTAAAGATAVDIKGWTLSALTIRPPANSPLDFVLTVRSRSREASNGALSADVTKNIAVNVNGTPTDILLGYSNPQFGENQAGVLIGTLTATDPNDATGSYAFSVTGGETARFVVRSGNQLWLQPGVALDYEAGAVTVAVHVNDTTTATTLGFDDTVSVRPADVNEPLAAISDTDGAVNTILDGAGAGTPVGVTARSLDPDGRTVTYSLTNNPNGWFTINAASGVVSVASGQTVQYETSGGSVTLTVQAADGGYDAAITKDFTLGVTDVNETPYFTSSNSTSLVEGTFGTTTIIANLTSGDPDLPGSTYGNPANRSYAIIAGDTGRFAIDGSNLIALAGATFDYEGMRSYGLTLRVTDGGGKTADQAFTVKVTNVNEDPYGAYDADGSGNVISEGTGLDTYTGVTVSASDPDHDALTYAITGDQLGWFRIDPTNGAVYTRAGIDYEQTTNGQIAINVAASDPFGRSTALNNIVINVNDANETPYITSANSARISEVAGYGSYVATITSGDPDRANSALGLSGHGYAIVGGDASRFYIDGNVIRTVGGLNYEGQQAYGFTIRVTDNNGAFGALSSDQDFVAYVDNVDEAPSQPQTGDGGYDYYVNENSGFAIGLVGSDDPEGTDVDYTFVAGANPAGWFAIDQNGGNSATLRLIAPRDFDVDKQSMVMEAAHRGYVDVRVVGYDRSSTYSIERLVRVHFSDVNDIAPAQPWMSAQTTTFNEGYNSGTVVAYLGNANGDGDGGLTPLSYGLADNPGGYFEVIDNQLRLRGGVQLDYEVLASGGSQTTLYPSVYASDGAYSSAAAAIAVQINNNNDCPTYFYQVSADSYVTENTPYGTPVAVARAADGDGWGVGYTITAGNVDNAFAIDGNGNITINAGVDYESGNWPANGADKYTDLQISASDGGATAYTSVRIHIIDLTLSIWTPRGDGQGEDLNPRFTVQRRYTYYSGPKPPNFPGAGNYLNEYSILDTVTGKMVAYKAEYGFSPNSFSSRPEMTAAYAAGYVKSGSWGYFSVISGDENNSNSASGRQWPIVLDLDDDGLDLVGLIEGDVFFDQDGDGARDRTSWVGSRDGILALDRNGDGAIDSGLEIAFKNDLPGAMTDLEGLAGFDSNADGVLDAQDARYGDFVVWRDANQDGVSDAGELSTLAELGITSMALDGVSTGEEPDGSDYAVVATSTYTTSDGQQHLLGDTVLSHFHTDTNVATQTDQPAAAEAQALPTGVRLSVDLDGNGVIAANEVVADAAGLAAYDDDRDGLISAKDERYYDLRTWTDLNGNGRAEPDELVGLDHALTAPIRVSGYLAAPTAGSTAPGIPAGPGGDTAEPTNVTPTAAIPGQGASAVGTSTDASAADHAAPTNPSVAEPTQASLATHAFAFKAGKYRIEAANGRMAVRPHGARGEIDAAAGTTVTMAILGFRNKSVGMAGLIVLDLDGDGLELQARKKSKAAFDMDNDGVADDTGWVGKGDGLLVIDYDGDGKIVTAAELSFLTEKADAASSFAGLATLDANRDGKLDKADARFGELKVWADANRNGTVEDGELRSLADLDIVSLSLKTTPLSLNSKVGDNIGLSTATFTRGDGQVATMGEAALAFAPSSLAQRLGIATDALEGIPTDAGQIGSAMAQLAAARMVEAMSGFGVTGAYGDGLSSPAMMREDQFALAAAH